MSTQPFNDEDTEEPELSARERLIVALVPWLFLLAVLLAMSGLKALGLR